MSQPIDTIEHKHVESDEDGAVTSVEYPAELVAALPALQATNKTLHTILIGPEPGMVVVRKLSPIEYRKMSAAFWDDSAKGNVLKSDLAMSLGQSAIVWPAADAVSTLVDDYPGIATMAGMTAFGLASGAATKAKKKH